MSRRKTWLALGVLMLAVGGVTAATAAFSSADGPTTVSAVRLVVFVPEGTSEQEASELVAEASQSADDALAFLAAAGLTLDQRPARRVSSSELGVALVEYDEALDACSAPRWREALDEIDGIGGDEIPILIGGVIRSTSPFEGLAGVACGPRVGACGATTPIGGTVLVDTYPNERVEMSALMAHELAHVFGVEHLDQPGPCGIDLADSAVGKDVPATVNLMSEVVHAGLVPEGTPHRRIRLSDVTLTAGQRQMLVDATETEK